MYLVTIWVKSEGCEGWYETFDVEDGVELFLKKKYKEHKHDHVALINVTKLESNK